MNIIARLIPRSLLIATSGVLMAIASPPASHAQSPCDGRPAGIGCPLPEHAEAKVPSDASFLGGNDQLSVTPYGGNLVVSATDLDVPVSTGVPMGFRRTYHSDRLLLGGQGQLSSDFQRRNGPLGLGWTFHYGVLWRVFNPQTQAVEYELVNGDGTREQFYVNDASNFDATTLRAVAPSAPYLSKSLSVLFWDMATDEISVYRPDGQTLRFKQVEDLASPSPICVGTLDIAGTPTSSCQRYVTTEVRDLDGNKITIAYDTTIQEYEEHPVITSVTDDLGRQITFQYAPVGQYALRVLQTLKLGTTTVATYATSTLLDRYHFLNQVTTAAGRKTSFTYNQTISGGAPAYQTIGLLLSMTTPLGGSVGVNYELKYFTMGSGYPTTVAVQTVKSTHFSLGAPVFSGGTKYDSYVYAQASQEFTTTVTHRLGTVVQATRLLKFHDYATGYCSNLAYVGLKKSDRLTEGTVFAEQTMAYGLPLEVSARAQNFYCPSTKPTILRVTSAGFSQPSGSGNYLETTTVASYDFLQPKVTSSTNGTSSSAGYRNVIESGILRLGLPLSLSQSQGGSLLSRTERVYSNSAGKKHQALDQREFYSPTGYDTISFKYYTSGSGKRGALSIATRGTAEYEYDYDQGIVSSVKLDKTPIVARSGLGSDGTYASETRFGVTTTHSWDADRRLTQLNAGSEPVHVAYCSKSQSGCSANTICISRGATCNSSPEGRRLHTFDELGRRTRQEDLVQGATSALRQWTAFDYADRGVTYVDPIRGTLTLAYDVVGRLASEKVGTTVVTSLARTFTSSHQEEIMTKEGLVLTRQDSWSGRPLLRSYKRLTQPVQSITQTWTWDAATNSWRSQFTYPGGVSLEEHFDLLGRKVREIRPEIGTVDHTYDARGFRTKEYFSNLGYSDCYAFNDLGQTTSYSRSSNSSCSGATVLRTHTYDANFRPTSVGATDSQIGSGSALAVNRNLSDFDFGGRPKQISIQIPRALDAPAPWVGAEIFLPPPNALADFRSHKIAFTSVDEGNQYEMEMREVRPAESLAPEYDWGRAQKECTERGILVNRGKWNHPLTFTGAALESFAGAPSSGYVFDDQPNTLYCWRVRSVKCHDGTSACTKPEIGAFSHWGVFAFNNAQARPVTSDGWLTSSAPELAPSNTDLRTPSSYQPCVGVACPNVTAIGVGPVELALNRELNVAGSPSKIVFPLASTTLEGWARFGSQVDFTYNGLGDPKSAALKLPGATAFDLLAYTSFHASGAPTAGKFRIRGYNALQPVSYQVISGAGGDRWGVANDPKPDLDMTWSYDTRARLTAHSAAPYYAVSGLTYSTDSLLLSLSRNDSGLVASYTATYDAQAQLTSYKITRSGAAQTVSYTIDARGNITNRTGSFLMNGLPNEQVSATGQFSNDNAGEIRLPARSFGPFGTNNRSQAADLAYDGEGRIVRDGPNYFNLSQTGRIETVLDSFGHVQAQLLYDGEGNLARIVHEGEANYLLHDEHGRLLYQEVHDAWFYGSQFRAASGRVVPNTRRYDYIYMGESHVATVEHAAGVSSIGYHVRDWRDFEVVGLDAEEGFAKRYHEPSPFGEEMRNGSASLTASNLEQPASHLRSGGIPGHLHNGWREFTPVHGRFARPDPARARHEFLPQGANLYANNLNNPLSYTDQDGEVAFLIPAAIVAYRLWSAYDTANDVIEVVDLAVNPETTNEEILTAGAIVAGGLVFGKLGSKVGKLGGKYVKRIAERAKKAKTCKQCFAAGTAVLTLTGTVAIESLSVGDSVMAFVPQSGTLSPQPVTAVHENFNRSSFIVRLEGAGGADSLTVTPEHPFLEVRRGWTDARHLRPGMTLRAARGDAVVRSVERGPALDATYNLTVGTFETFAVGQSGVVVHNCADQLKQLGVKLTGKARKILGDIADLKDMDAARAIIERGGKNSNVREALGDELAGKTVGEIGNLAAKGHEKALTAVKIIKGAAKYGQRY